MTLDFSCPCRSTSIPSLVHSWLPSGEGSNPDSPFEASLWLFTNREVKTFFTSRLIAALSLLFYFCFPLLSQCRLLVNDSLFYDVRSASCLLTFLDLPGELLTTEHPASKPYWPTRLPSFLHHDIPHIQTTIHHCSEMDRTQSDDCPDSHISTQLLTRGLYSAMMTSPIRLS